MLSSHSRQKTSHSIGNTILCRPKTHVESSRKDCDNRSLQGATMDWDELVFQVIKQRIARQVTSGG